MTEQPDLFGSQPPADKSLFLALLPDAEALSCLSEAGASLLASNPAGGRLLALDRMHITLHDFGLYAEIPDGLKASVSKACEVVAGLSRPFEVCLHQVKNFGKPGNRAVCLAGDRAKNDGLLDFHGLLIRELAMHRCALGKTGKLSPHLTLFYGRKESDEQAVDPVSWMATEFVLVCSHQGQGRHERLGSWKLGS